MIARKKYCCQESSGQLRVDNFVKSCRINGIGEGGRSLTTVVGSVPLRHVKVDPDRLLSL